MAPAELTWAELLLKLAVSYKYVMHNVKCRTWNTGVYAQNVCDK